VRQTTSLLFLLLFCSKFIYVGYWLIEFHINQEEIIKTECENKNRPELNCNGKCYLAKKLLKAESDLSEKKNKQTESVSHLKSLESLVLFNIQEKFFLSFSINIMQDGVADFHYQNTYAFLSTQKVFHPPCTILS